MLKLEDKDIKIVISTVLYMFKKLSRDKEDIKKTQMKLLRMKIAMSEAKNALSGIKGRLDIA